jgi:hypothetical protein
MRGAPPSFTLEAHESISVARKSLRHDLQCDIPATFRVEGSVDVSRAIRARRRLDFVGAEFPARGEDHPCRAIVILPCTLQSSDQFWMDCHPALSTFGAKEEMHAAMDQYFLLFESKCPEAPHELC